MKWILIGLLLIASVSFGADTIQYTKPSDSGVTIPILTTEPTTLNIDVALSDEPMDENAPGFLNGTFDLPDHIEIICGDDMILRITITGENAVTVDCESRE